MGEIAEMFLDGTLCEMCGVNLDGKCPGYPRYCSVSCAKNREIDPEVYPITVVGFNRKNKNKKHGV